MTPAAVDTVRAVTNRKGRQKTLIVNPELVELLAIAVDFMGRAGVKDYSEARLIRNAMREAVADLAERAADEALARLARPPAELKEVRREVERRRRLLHDAALRAGLSDD